MHLKMSSGKWQQFCLSINVLNVPHQTTTNTTMHELGAWFSGHTVSLLAYPIIQMHRRWSLNLTHWPKGDAVVISSNFHIKNLYLHFLWNYSCVNVTRPHWWLVNIGWGNGLVVSGNKPLTDPMVTQILVTIYVTKQQWDNLPQDKPSCCCVTVHQKCSSTLMKWNTLLHDRFLREVSGNCLSHGWP